MAKTELSTKKTQDNYKVLAESFLTKSFPGKNFDSMAKSNFLRICMINNLDPFKWEIYPLPFTWSNGITTISPVIDYHVFLNRAEESWKLSWRRIEHKKDGKKIVSSKITIHRDDRKEPFVYEADFDDLKTVNTKKTSLWDTKPEMMMRKQMIRIGFSLAFPESCAKLNPELEDRDPEMVEIIDSDVINDDPDLPPMPDENELAPKAPGADDGKPVSEDQKRIIDELVKDIPWYIVVRPLTYKQAEEEIFKIKEAIFKEIMKNKQPCTDDYLSMVFGNSDDVRIQGMHSTLKEEFKNW